jgi:tRNA modification GTPase
MSGFSTDDTIAAIATPLGRSGVGIVRVSGPDAAAIVGRLLGRSRPLAARHATLARLPSLPTSVADQVIVTHFPKPHSYTGEDVTEISAHGSPVVLQGILRALIDTGARLAAPGEFTLRAFLNGKLDLIQAEAVADLIDSVTPLQARAAFDQLDGTLTAAIAAIESQLFDLMARLEASLDFPEEGYHFVAVQSARGEIEQIRERIQSLLRGAARGRLVRDGARIALVGTPNVGKSSLFNALLQANRAIVTPIAGTTRDLVTERADIGGLSMALVDTAGIRATTDVVEVEGVARARQAAAHADLVIVVLDGSRAPDADDRALVESTAGRARVIAMNKCDLADAWSADEVSGFSSVRVSAVTGQGLDTLVDCVVSTLGDDAQDRDAPLVTNIRHIALLEGAQLALDRAIAAVAAGDDAISEEFLLADLQEASGHLQEITGQRTTDDLLRHIFQHFCIGK